MAIDFFFALIFSFLIFGVAAYPIFNSLPSTNEQKTNYGEAGKELVKIADETHLQKATDDSFTSLLSINETARFYLTELLKTSSFINGIPYQEMKDGKKVTIEFSEDDTFLKEDYSNDNLGYYFLSFKDKNKIGNYINNGKDYSSEKRLYLNSVILKLDSENKDLVPDSFDLKADVFYLNEKNTSLLMNYLSFNDYNEEVKNLYSRLEKLYVSSASLGIKEVESNYQKYKDTYSKFNSGYVFHSNGFMVSSFISYLFGGIVSYLVFPLCFKKGRGLGNKILHLEVTKLNGDPFSWPWLLIKALVQIILSFWSVVFIPLFMGQFPFVLTPLFSSVSSLALFVFSLLMMLLSLIFYLFNKNQQTLSDLASYSVVKSQEIHKKGDLKNE